MNFKTLYDAGSVKRYHTNVTIKEQDLAAHQWGVAMIVREIAPGNLPLLEAALTHDLAESVTGDIPYTAKKRYDTIRIVSDTVEAQFNDKYGLKFDLSPEDKHVLAWADMFECYLFSRRESWLGNQTMRRVMDTARDALANMGTPNERAAALFREYHG